MFFFFFFDEETGKTEKVPVEGLPAEIADAGFEFFDDNIRYVWHKQEEEFYFSVVDVVGVLTGSEKPRRYWSDLKHKLKSEGSCETYEKIVQLKMPAADGKMRMTDVANMEQLLRIIQSIPSPKAEPFKQWLAQVGKERLDETIDPQIARLESMLERAKKAYAAGIDTLEEYGSNKKRIIAEIDDLKAKDAAQTKETVYLPVLEVQNRFDGLVSLLKSDADVVDKHRAAAGIIDHIVFNRKEESLEVFFYL